MSAPHGCAPRPDSSAAGGAPRICLIRPNRDAYSETFIRAHIEGLPLPLVSLYAPHWPRSDADGRAVLGFHDRILSLLRRRLGQGIGSSLRGPLARYLRRGRFDAVLAEYGTTGALLLEPCAAADLPLVVVFHGYDAYHRAILESFAADYRRLFTQAAGLVAVSSAMADQLIALGAPRERVHVNPCGVDLRRFQPGDVANSGLLLLAVGRFVGKKSPQSTLRAFALAHARIPAARLQMIGEGPLLADCRELARSLGVSEAVDFPGALPHAEIASRMQRARAFVQHSVRLADGDAEGTPVSVLEAAASALPVVATRHMGIAEAVVGGETGLLVDEGDIEGMAHALVEVLEHPQRAAQLGRAGRAHVEAHYALEHTLAALARIVQDAIAAHRSRSAQRAGRTAMGPQPA